VTHDRPQVIVRFCPPGSLLKRTDAPPRPRKVETDNDPAYLALVRQCPCLSCGLDPAGEAAHVRLSSAAHGKSNAMGKKPADRHSLPLCADCHRLGRTAQHQGSERAFWIRLDIPPLYTCQQLYAQRGDLVAMRAVVIRTISERGK
jgi:hypothetical protein